MKSRVGILVLVACSAFACTDKPVEQAPSAAPAEQAPAPSAAAVAEPAEPVAIPEAELKELLSAWLAAQNSGQFAAYEALYASKFYGVKRAGQREVRFDRSGWLSDRQKMFQKPISVEARAPSFRASSASAEIEFEQQWSSGKFADSGPKRLLVVREGGKLKIAQEEMLRSELVATKSEQRAADFYFTLALDSGFYVSLPRAKVPDQLGPIAAESGEKNTDVFSASRVVPDAVLPASLSDLKRKKLRLEGGCVATISEFRALTRVVPHFGERERWNGVVEGQEKKGTPMPAAQIARAAYALGKPQLFAKLDGCSEGRFAWIDGTRQPVAAEPVEDPELAERALAAFGKLPNVLARQKEFLKQAEHPEGKWWEEGTEVAIFKHPKSGQVLVSVLAILRDGCSGFSASEWAIFEHKGKALKRIPLTQNPPDRVQDALDVDGDGRLEFLGETDYGTDSVLYWPDANELGTSLEHAYLDCPC
jgi:hypothetical protein